VLSHVQAKHFDIATCACTKVSINSKT
jgi:hypothetical protein